MINNKVASKKLYTLNCKATDLQVSIKMFLKNRNNILSKCSFSKQLCFARRQC